MEFATTVVMSSEHRAVTVAGLNGVVTILCSA